MTTTSPAKKLHRLFRIIKPRPGFKNSYGVFSLLIEISLQPGADISTLASSLKLPRPTVHNYLQTLIRDGLAKPNARQHRTPGCSVLKCFPTLTPAGVAAVEKITAIIA